MTAIPVLGVQDLTFAYRKGGEELFDGLTHTFTRGRVTAVTGASGRGKSTLLYLMALLLSPSSGQVWFGGVNLAGAPDRDRAAVRANRIGFVFQDSELDPRRTVLDSVLEPALYAGYLPEERRHAALALLDRFGLAGRANHRPGQVSGGQAQRVAVCRALVNEPDVLLADEPTGNLDRGNAELVLGALRSTADSGRTVVIATHDPFVLDQVDEVLEL